MSTTWKTPVSDPRIASAYTDALLAQNHDKAHAADTPFRFSDAMGCARALGYKAAGIVPTDPMDGPSLAITAMGSVLHEDIQAAVIAKYLATVAETTGDIGDLISGHIDLDDEDDDSAVEIKTVGAFKFDLSIGLIRSPGRGQPPKRVTPKGPSLAHICQGGFNARSHGRSKVRIVYISREAVAVKKARLLKMDSVDRFAAEWVIERDVWEPIVDHELARLRGIRSLVATGELPERIDLDDGPDGKIKVVHIDIETHWRCDGYCPYTTQCRADGPGRVAVRTS